MSKPFYLSMPIDEYVLEKDVIKKYPWLLERVPSQKELLQIQKETDIDHATMAINLALKSSLRYGPFIQKIKEQKLIKRTTEKKDLLWGLVPAMLYKAHPEVGAGGEHILSVGKELNLRVERIPVGEKAGVITNAHLIKKWMDDHPNEKIGMITMSKGSLDFRYAWDYLFTDEDKARIQMWLNLSGFANGAGLANLLLRTWKSRLMIYLAQKYVGLERYVVRECQTDYPAWKNQFEIAPHVKVYSFFPLPLTSHVQTSLMGRYKKISQLGPNDGLTDSYRSIYWEGEAFPLWGADHFCRTADMVPTIYKLFSYIIENEL